MAKLCPLIVSDGKSQPCNREQCAWWIEIEDHDDGGLCSIGIIAYNSGGHDQCEHE